MNWEKTKARIRAYGPPLRRHWNEWLGVMLGITAFVAVAVSVQARITNQRYKPIQEKWEKIKAERPQH
jgi:hypothetical protein